MHGFIKALEEDGPVNTCVRESKICETCKFKLTRCIWLI